MELHKICSFLSLGFLLLAAVFFIACIPNKWSKGEANVGLQQMMMAMANRTGSDNSGLMNMLNGFGNTMGTGSNPFGGLGGLGGGDIDPFKGLGDFGGSGGSDNSTSGGKTDPFKDPFGGKTDSFKDPFGGKTDPFKSSSGGTLPNQLKNPLKGLSGLDKSKTSKTSDNSGEETNPLKSLSDLSKFGKSDTSEPFPGIGDPDKMFNKMTTGSKMSVTVQYTLRKMCHQIKYDISGFPAPVKKLMGGAMKPITQCISFSDMKKHFKTVNDTSLRKIMEHGVKRIEATFACMVSAALVTTLAMVVAIMKTPCVKLSRKGIVRLVTVGFSIVAALAGVAGIALFDQKVYGKDISGFEYAFKTASIEFTHSKEMSYTLAIVGEVCLLLGIALTLLEAFVTKRKQYDGEDTYKILERNNAANMPQEL